MSGKGPEMTRLGFFGRKLAVAALTIVGAVACLFLLLEFVPGNLADAVLGTNATAELRASFAAKMGLDQPLYIRMARFLGGAFTGDFGDDIISGQPIIAMLTQVFPFTLALAFSSLFTGLILGIPLGCLAATRPGSWADRALGVLSIAFIAVPNFVISISLLLIFSLTLHLLPVAGAGEPGDLGDQLLHLILPTIALSLGWIGYVARILRASLLEVLAEPHIRTMRAYGVGEGRVIWRYALRPALVPLVAILGLGLGDMISGAIFAEIIFARPGIGSLLSHAVSARNYPVVQAGSLFVVVFYIAANAGADMLAAMVDPRIAAARGGRG
jgi:peptide/nickel transport system permease protein